MLLFSVGGGMSILKGIEHWNARSEHAPVGWTFLVLGLAFVLELSSFIVAVRKLAKSKTRGSFLAKWRDSKDPSVFTVVAEDGAALVGILIAFAGVGAAHVTKKPVYDALASLLIGVVLILVAIVLAYENRGLLIGESARAPLVDGVRRIVERDPSVRAAGELLTMHLGPSEVLLEAKVAFVPSISGDEIRGAIRRIEAAIRRDHPTVTRIFIEAT